MSYNGHPVFVRARHRPCPRLVESLARRRLAMADVARPVPLVPPSVIRSTSRARAFSRPAHVPIARLHSTREPKPCCGRRDRDTWIYRPAPAIAAHARALTDSLCTASARVFARRFAGLRGRSARVPSRRPEFEPDPAARSATAHDAPLDMRHKNGCENGVFRTSRHARRKRVLIWAIGIVTTCWRVVELLAGGCGWGESGRGCALTSCMHFG